MGRMRKLSEAERAAERTSLFEAASTGTLSIAEAVRRMRRVTGLTQAAFARRVAGISPGALAQIERGHGNPTVQTLNRIGAAFGLEVGLIRRRSRAAPKSHPGAGDADT